MSERAAPRFLVLGRTGQVGHDLAVSLAPLGTVHATNRDEVDFLVPESIARAITTHAPDVVVNAIAYTAVDKAESDAATAEQVNVRGVEILARTAREVGACVVHYSTDYVFDGSKTEPWVESDPTAPLGVYGRTKLLGEEALASAGVPYLVLRTSWVYATRASNFLRTILRAAREREVLSIVDDQRGAPTWSRVIAGTTATILGRAQEDVREYMGRHSGVYHLSAAGSTSWYGFARAILAADPEREKQKVREVRAISTAEYPTAAKRPANSLLSNSKLAQHFGVRQMDWKEQLQLAFEEHNFF